MTEPDWSEVAYDHMPYGVMATIPYRDTWLRHATATPIKGDAARDPEAIALDGLKRAWRIREGIDRETGE